MAKTGEEQNGWDSGLPYYEIVKREYRLFDDDPEHEQFPVLEVICPKCNGTFWVEEDRWVQKIMNVIKKQLVMIGRSCPYCYKTARIPNEFRQGGW